MNKNSVVIGIGNPYLQDDRVGLAVIEQLEQEGLHCRTEVVTTPGFELLDRMRGYRRAIIVDACQLGQEPGTIIEGTVDALLSAPSSANSHAITLDTTLKVGYLCFPEEMPDDIGIILIEVKELKAFTQRMSSEVEAAVVEVVSRIKIRILATV